MGLGIFEALKGQKTAKRTRESYGFSGGIRELYLWEYFEFAEKYENLLQRPTCSRVNSAMKRSLPIEAKIIPAPVCYSSEKISE
jgi:hypothetical protein